MPLTLTLTEGVLPIGSEKNAIERITDAFLKAHGLSENKVMRENITAHYVVLPKNQTFAGGKEIAGAWVEWKTPSFALANSEAQKPFFLDATDIIHDLSDGRQPRGNIYVNVVHAVDGGWNMNGLAMTNAEIVDTIS